MQAKEGEFTCQRVTCQRATPIDRGGSEKIACGSGGLAAAKRIACGSGGKPKKLLARAWGEH